MNDFTLTSWRIIRDTPSRGSWNMAVDEAILDAVRKSESPATLRLYAWEPACLSLGYAQSVSDVDLDALKQHGWDLVRRPTGGRAILHTDELTYSVIAPPTDPRLEGSVVESYMRLSRAILNALHLLGIPAEALEKPAPTAPANNPSSLEQNPVCFEVPSNYEITVAGKKLVGSAQARRRDGVLQHGTFPLYGDLRRITRVLNFSSEDERTEAGSRLLARAITAENILEKPLAWQEAADAFERAFSEMLDLQLILGELSPSEELRARELEHEKYANMRWTGRS